MGDTISPVLVPPRRCLPIHGVEDRAKLAGLVASMEAEGWVGAPLIGWETADGADVWLCNGSHRLAAAEAIGLDEIPVLLIEATYEDLVDCGAVLDGLIGIYDAERARVLGGVARLIPLTGDEG